MKKLLFSAIAMVAFAGSVSASNEIVLEKLSAETENQSIEILSASEVSIQH